MSSTGTRFADEKRVKQDYKQFDKHVDKTMKRSRAELKSRMKDQKQQAKDIKFAKPYGVKAGLDGRLYDKAINDRKREAKLFKQDIKDTKRIQKVYRHHPLSDEERASLKRKKVIR